MADEGIVYVLSNEAMPGLIKIGLTKRDELEARLNELYSTGVPLPFTCEYACRVKDCKAVENALHTAFTKDRVNPAREFFRTSVEYVKPILELLKIEDITTDVENDMNTGINSTEIEALNNYKKRRPQLNFEEMGIAVGSELVMNYNDQQYKAIVSSARTVKYNEDEFYLSALTAQIMEAKHPHVQPTPHWSFNGKVLSDIYDETYSYQE